MLSEFWYSSSYTLNGHIGNTLHVYIHMNIKILVCYYKINFYNVYIIPELIYTYLVCPSF